MKSLRVLLVVSLAGLALCAFKPLPSNTLNDFRLVTFNVRNSDMPDSGERSWAARRPVARAMLLGLQADILGLQEVSPGQRANLDEDLSGYQGAGTGREGHGQGEQCPIYSRRGLKIESDGVFWLSPTPMKPSIGWDAKMPRICTWIRYPGLTVFNTHLDYAGPESRRQALRLIRRQAKGSAVILGDFNDREGSQALDPVDDLVDAFRAVHPRLEPKLDGMRTAQNTSTYHAFQGENRVSHRIDFVFVTPDLEPLEAEIVEPAGAVFPSDHWALSVHLRRRAASGH